MTSSCVCNSYTDQLFQWILGFFPLLPYGIATFIEAVTAIIFGAGHQWYDVVVTLVLLITSVAFLIEKRSSKRILGIIKRSSLAAKVRREKRKHFKRTLFAQFENFKLWCSTPSRGVWWSFICLFLLAFFLNHTCLFQYEWLLWCSDDVQVSAFLAALGGFSSVLFALIIFIAQLGTDVVREHSVRVFLVRTNLLFVAPLCLSCFILFLGPTINALSVILLFVLFLLTANAVFWVIRLTLNQTEMEKAADALIQRDLVLNVEGSITNRFSQIVLRAELEKMGKVVELLPWLFDREDYDHVTLPESGKVADLNLSLLEEVVERITPKIERNKASVEASTSELKSEKGEDEKDEEKTLAYLRKGLGDSVEGSDRTVLSIKKGILSDKDLDEVRQLTRLSYRLEKGNVDQSAELRNVFKELRERYVSTLRDKPGSQVDSYVRRYANLSEEFLKVLLRYLGNYDFRSARNEISNELWGQSWEEIGWLEDDVRAILEYALKHAMEIQTDALLSTLYLPMAICYRAIELTDNLLFQKFLPLLVTQLHHGHRIENEQLRELVKDRCVQYPKELVGYCIVPKLKKKDRTQLERQRIKDSILYMFSVYGGLIREAYLNGDVTYVNKFIYDVNSCANDFKPSKDRWDVEHLKWRLDAATSQTQREDLNEQIEEQEFLESLAREIAERKKAILCDVASKLLYGVYDGGDIDWSESLTTALRLLPSNLYELADVCADANKLDSSRLVSYGRWQRKSPEGGAWIRDDSNHSEVLCLKLLTTPNILQAPVDQRKVSVDMGYRADTEGAWNTALKSIESNAEKLGHVLSEDDLTQIHDVRRVFKEIHDAHKSNERENKQNAVLSENRTRDFKQSTKKSFDEHIFVRKILKSIYECYIDRGDKYEKQDVVTVGLNMIDDKATFIEPWHVSYSGWGRAFGEGVASGEDGYLIQKLREFSQTENRSNLVRRIGDVEGCYIILVNASPYLLFRELGIKFTPDYQIESRRNEPGFAGTITVEKAEIDVFSVHAGGEEQGALVLSKKLNVSIEQFAPFEEEKKTFERLDELGIEITDLNADGERRDSFVKKAPQWLLEESADQEEQIAYLRGRVQIMVIERMRVTISSPEDEGMSYAFWIPIEDDE